MFDNLHVVALFWLYSPILVPTGSRGRMYMVYPGADDSLLNLLLDRYPPSHGFDKPSLSQLALL